MSFRGGRGGSRGGGGGGKAGVRQFGLELDPELDSLADSAPSETYPPVQPPVAELPSAEERYLVDHYRFLRRRFHEGDFYTILGDEAWIKRSATGKRIREPATAHFDPFEDQPTYGKRFKREHKTLPVLSNRHFETRFFPPELWSTIDPKHNPAASSKPPQFRTKKAKNDDIDAMERDGTHQDEPGDDEDKEDDDKADKDEDDEDKDEDGENADEDQDEDQFSDGDDNDDYNAEMYFNDGGDDDDGDRGGDDYGGGDDTY